VAEGQDPEVDLKALQEELASFDVEQFLVSPASTLASLGYAKIDRGALPEARKAIDVLASLVPHLEGELAADLARALTGLQLAYAKAAS
jgi:hypothetical protein